MTTNVTVKSCSWPVQVTTVDRYSADHVSGGNAQRVLTETTTVETVPPHSERTFYITNSRSIAFDELPLPAEDAGS